MDREIQVGEILSFFYNLARLGELGLGRVECVGKVMSKRATSMTMFPTEWRAKGRNKVRIEHPPVKVF